MEINKKVYGSQMGLTKLAECCKRSGRCHKVEKKKLPAAVQEKMAAYSPYNMLKRVVMERAAMRKMASLRAKAGK